MSGSRVARTILTLLTTAAIVVAVALAVRLFILFVGQIHAMPAAKAFDALASHLVIPFGMRAIKTPYHGVFDPDTALTVVVALLAEWGLSAVRDRA